MNKKSGIFDELKEFFLSILQSKDLEIPIILLITGLISYSIGTARIQYDKESINWPGVGGKIISVDIRRKNSGGVKTPGGGNPAGYSAYKAEIIYEYTVDGKNHRSDHISFGADSFSDKNKALAIINNYSAGQEVTVYYKPDNPGLAVIETGKAEKTSTIIIIGTAFSILGFISLIIAVFNRIRNFIRKHTG